MKILFFALVFAFASHCFALDDTPENRSAQADRYLAAVTPGALIGGVAGTVSKSLPEEQRATFTKMMTEYIDIGAMTATMKASLVKIFTADELKAQADSHGSPVGQSIRNKMGSYMGDLMPALQGQMQAAAVKAMAATRKKTAAPVPSASPAAAPGATP